MPGDSFATVWRNLNVPGDWQAMASLADEVVPSVDFEPRNLDLGDREGDKSALSGEIQPRGPSLKEVTRLQVRSATPSIRVIPDEGKNGVWQVTVESGSRPWGHVHGMLQLSGSSTGSPGFFSAEIPVRAYLLGPWEVSPRSLYLGIIPAGTSPHFQVTLKPRERQPVEWGKAEALGPFPVTITRSTEPNGIVILQGLANAGDFRGRFNGEIRVWPKGDNDRYLRIPFFGLVQNGASLVP